MPAGAEVVLFTAGLEDYAKPILDRLQQRYTCFHSRLYRPATSASRSYPCIKVSSLLGSAPCQPRCWASLHVIRPHAAAGAGLGPASIVSMPGAPRLILLLSAQDLSRLGRDLRCTILVDDTPLAFVRQPHNGLPVLTFRCVPSTAQPGWDLDRVAACTLAAALSYALHAGDQQNAECQAAARASQTMCSGQPHEHAG